MTQLNNELIRKETIQLANDGPTVHTTKYETKVPTLHKSYLLFFSLIISALTIAVPFFTDAANSLQSQNLYIGMMLTKGQIPYSDVFTTGGLLYFVVIALSYYLGTTLWLVFVQAFVSICRDSTFISLLIILPVFKRLPWLFQSVITSYR